MLSLKFKKCTPGRFTAYVAAPLLLLLALNALAPVVHKHFTLNSTDSLPKGIYYTKPPVPGSITRGTLVCFKPPGWTHPYIYGRHWARDGAPLMKPVGAVAGDHVVVTHEAIFINGTSIGPMRDKDSQGRPLPQQPGPESYIVPDGFVLPLSTHIPNSFDGRYFGCIRISQLLSVAEPLLTF